MLHWPVASKSSVHSIRIQNELWEWLTEEAKRRGVTPNGLVCDLLLVSQLRAAEVKATEKPDPAPKAAFKSRLKGEWKAP